MYLELVDTLDSSLVLVLVPGSLLLSLAQPLLQLTQLPVPLRVCRYILPSVLFNLFLHQTTTACQDSLNLFLYQTTTACQDALNLFLYQTSSFCTRQQQPGKMS